MGLSQKIKFIIKYPLAIVQIPNLKKHLKKNREKGIANWVFQCDFEGHFSYLKPYWNRLKDDQDVEVFFSILPRENGKSIKKFLINKGIPTRNIIEPADYVRLMDFDVYMSPTEWGNVFPKNNTCMRTQIFHTLADKGLEYSKALTKFNTIFVNGPLHHDFLEKYVFDPYPESKSFCKTYNVGFAKVDELFDGTYSKKEIGKYLNIEEDNDKLTVLYAPNWDKGSALHTYGEAAFEALMNTGHTILIKLHYMSLLSKENYYATGGVDWKKLLDKYRAYDNIRIIDDDSINAYLYFADVMVSDFGGAPLEFMIMDKPIIYLDCPAFFDDRGHDIFEKKSRETGYLIDDLKEIDGILDEIAKGNDSHLKKRRALIEKLLYNRGNAALTGINILKELTQKQVK